MTPEAAHARVAHGILAGAVRLPDGRPVPGAAVTVTDPATGRQVSAAQTTPAGTYRIGLTESGTYLVIVSAPGRRPAADLVTVPGGSTGHDVVLGGSGALAGTTRTAPAGAPLPGAVVTLTDVRGQVVATATTAADGGYRLEDLDAGDYTLAGTAPGTAPVARAVTVPGTADLTFAAPRYRIAAIVAAADGAPLAGVVVRLYAADGTCTAGVSDAQGGMVFDELPDGGYLLDAEACGPGAAVARAVGGRVTRADIRLAVPAVTPGTPVA